MKTRNITTTIAMAATLAFTTTTPADAKPPEEWKVLIITGADGHPWEANTNIMIEHFKAWNITNVDQKIVRDDNQWAKWEGDYNDYDVILVQYYQPAGDEEYVAKLEEFVAKGGALVGVHSGIAGFDNREKYDAMVGMGWRGADYGKSLMYSADGEKILREPGEGGGSAHPPINEFQVSTIDKEHPITNRLPTEVWMQTQDELYYNMRGPVGDIHVLAVASRGVPNDEAAPQLWVNEYKDGRVFVTTLGHFEPSVDSVGFMTTLVLGMEWAITGDTTLPIPSNFPSENESSKGTPQFD